MQYFFMISAVAAVMTVYDKVASKHFRRHRIPEAVLLLCAAVGGSVAMMFTMLLIRHKTRKYKFMIGIPLIIMAQVILLYLVKKTVF